MYMGEISESANKRPNLKALTVAFSPLILLFLLDLVVGDTEFFRLINQNLANPVLDFACSYGSLFLFAASYGIILFRFFYSRNATANAIGIISVITGACCYIVGSLLKILIMRPRPLDIAVLSISRTLDFGILSPFSFPSTTTMLVFGLALPIIFENPRFGAVLISAAYFTGFSVIYLGFHFPLDVVAGAFLSLDISLILNILKKPLTKFLAHRLK